SLVSVLTARGRKARVLPLGSAAPGLLDPFSFGDDLAARRTMATETLRLLLPRMSEERESAMIQAVAAVARPDRPRPGKGGLPPVAPRAPAAKKPGSAPPSLAGMPPGRAPFPAPPPAR